MLFDIEADNGTSLVAYVVPDSGGATPEVRLRGDGVELLHIEANEPRPHLVAAGRHATGLCGFNIDEALVPGLATYADLELREAASGTLVYRRRPARAIDAKIFRMETHLLPLRRLDAGLSSRFQYWYGSIDRLGRETATQVFCLEAASIFISGRLHFKSFEHFLTRGIETVAVLRDPYLELAERLILLKHIGARADEMLGPRDAMTFAPVMAALQYVDLDDEAATRRFVRRAAEPTLRVLSNPLVRQLTTTMPDEMPGAAGVSSALDALAMFEVIGLRADPLGFVEAFAAMVGLEARALPVPREHEPVAALGGRLRAIQSVEAILEKDLEVFDTIANAYAALEPPQRAAVP